MPADEIQEQVFKKTVVIAAPVDEMWKKLTTLADMKVWMSEAVIEIVSDFEVGSPINIRGQLYKTPFDNFGTILAFDKERRFCYEHLSSLSRLPFIPANCSVINFDLVTLGNSTEVTLTITNFPTDAIYKHLAFYWNVTLVLFKKFVEGTSLSSS